MPARRGTWRGRAARRVARKGHGVAACAGPNCGGRGAFAPCEKSGGNFEASIRVLFASAPRRQCGAGGTEPVSQGPQGCPVAQGTGLGGRRALPGDSGQVAGGARQAPIIHALITANPRKRPTNLRPADTMVLTYDDYRNSMIARGGVMRAGEILLWCGKLTARKCRDIIKTIGGLT